MSLDSELSITRLRAIAGYAFERGDAYMRQGRVLRCERADAGVVRGTVVGTQTYQVELSIEGRRLEARCTCPMGGGFCKHAVALALFWHEHGVDAAPAPARAPAGDWFETPAEAVAWAEDHRVSYLMTTSALRIAHELRVDGGASGLTYAFARWPFSALASREGAARLAYSLAPARTAAAARRVMVAEADAVAAGIAEESQRAAPPSAPASAQLWARLLALRAEVRRSAMPRSRAARAGGELGFDRDALALVWTDRDGTPGAMRGMVARLTGRIGDDALACDCGAPGGRCVHGLALIDSALEVLAAGLADAEAIAAELVRPGWSRALAALAERAIAPAAPRPAIEVWWQLDPDGAAALLAPVVKKQLKRGGLSAGTRTTAARLLHDHADALDPRDRADRRVARRLGPGLRRHLPRARARRARRASARRAAQRRRGDRGRARAARLSRRAGGPLGPARAGRRRRAARPAHRRRAAGHVRRRRAAPRTSTAIARACS